MLAACAAVALLKERVVAFRRPWAPLGWLDVALSLLLLALCQLGCAEAGRSDAAPFGGMVDLASLAAYLAAVTVSTTSELARRAAFAESGGRVAICTRGVFGWVRHPAWLSDIVGVMAWAALAGAPGLGIMLAIATGVIGGRKAIVEDDAFLRQAPSAYRAWVARTPSFIPYLF